MTGVGLRGRDADLAIDMGTVTRNQNAPAGTMRQVDLGSINMMQHQNTWRRVLVRQQNFTKKFIYFTLRLDEELNNSSYPSNTRYPQKHVIYLQLHGANGPNGFVPCSAGDVGEDNVRSGGRPISRLSNALQIRQFYGASNIRNFTGISEQDDWAVGTMQDWWGRGADYSGITLANSRTAAQIYTRNSSLIAQLTGNQAAPDFSMNYSTLKVAKMLHLFWSRNDVCTFRIELDLRSMDARYISIQKYTGAMDYS